MIHEFFFNAGDLFDYYFVLRMIIFYIITTWLLVYIKCTLTYNTSVQNLSSLKIIDELMHILKYRFAKTIVSFCLFKSLDIKFFNYNHNDDDL